MVLHEFSTFYYKDIEFQANSFLSTFKKGLLLSSGLSNFRSKICNYSHLCFSVHCVSLFGLLFKVFSVSPFAQFDYDYILCQLFKFQFFLLLKVLHKVQIESTDFGYFQFPAKFLHINVCCQGTTLIYEDFQCLTACSQRLLDSSIH